MMYLLHSGRKLLLASTVYNVYLSAQTQSSSCSVHSYISTAHYGYLLAVHNRGVGILIKCLHQITSGKILICRENTVGVFSGNTHKLGKPGAGTDKYRAKALLVHKLVNGNSLSHYHIGLNFHTQGFYILNFLCHNRFLGKTEFRNTVYQHTARLMERLKNGHIIAHLCQIAGTGKTCRTGADYSYLLSLFLSRTLRLNAVFSCPVGYETLQLTDRYRVTLDSANTFSLTLCFLRTHTSTDSRQRTGFADNLISSLNIALLYLLHKSGNIDCHRAALHALRIFTVDTSGSLCHCLLHVIAQTNLFKVCGTLLCVLLSHRHFI